MNIGFVSASGNVGKSTISLNFLISLLEEYENNVIQGLDADERMKTLSHLMALRKKHNFSYVDVVSSPNEVLEELNNKKKINIVDLKGHLGEKEATIINKLDLIIVITNNESLVVKKTLQFCKDFQKNKISYKVLCNGFHKKVGKTQQELKDIFKNHLLDTIVMRRDSYTRIDDNGSTDYDRFLSGVSGLYRTKREIDNLRNEILKIGKLV